MSDEKLAHISGIFIEHDIADKYNWTFDQFISAYESGYYQKLIEGESV